LVPEKTVDESRSWLAYLDERERAEVDAVQQDVKE
jgi:hypothetical protein